MSTEVTPVVMVHELGDGMRLAIEMPGDGAQLSHVQAREIVFHLRAWADAVERDLARGLAEAAARGDAS